MVRDTFSFNKILMAWIIYESYFKKEYRTSDKFYQEDEASG